MYYSRQTVRTLTTIVLLAVLSLVCALLFIARENIINKSIVNAPVSTSTPETQVAYTTPQVPVYTPGEVAQIATSTEERLETISKAPVERRVRTTSPPQVDSIVRVIPAPEVEQQSAVGFDASVMLHAHNEVREEHGLTPLTWSNTLAESAREWGKILTKNECDFYHDPNTSYGENLYWQWITDSDNSSLISTPEEAVTWWADEIRFYNYKKNTCRRGEDCGHYTQIVWADTTQVGCSVNTCFDRHNDNTQTDLWICRYDPPGNIEGEKPY
ncbi:hypothetical protein IPH92_00830 [Candidatus Kaiserbacteria bacterium]|nr:MAG: hypothetical protein IPH92_00830 [Candidatus Kaiserbacteria bacterium]